jgi:hypothetical protein
VRRRTTEHVYTGVWRKDPFWFSTEVVTGALSSEGWVRFVVMKNAFAAVWPVMGVALLISTPSHDVTLRRHRCQLPSADGCRRSGISILRACYHQKEGRRECLVPLF